jgi:hypothetical protein
MTVDRAITIAASILQPARGESSREHRRIRGRADIAGDVSENQVTSDRLTFG